MENDNELAPEIEREEKPAPPSTVGAMLQAARATRGLSLAQAEKATRIHQAYLEALEADDWARLPESTFTKGFLRTYALYLGLDAPALLRQYHQQTRVPAPEGPTIRPATKPLRTPSTIGLNLFVGVLFFLGFVLLAAYIYYRQYLPAATPTPTLVLSTALPPTATPVPQPVRPRPAFPVTSVKVPSRLGARSMMCPLSRWLWTSMKVGQA